MSVHTQVIQSMMERLLSSPEKSCEVKLMREGDKILISLYSFVPKKNGKGNKRVVTEKFSFDVGNGYLTPLPLASRADTDYTIQYYFKQYECHAATKAEVKHALGITEHEFYKFWEQFQLNPNFLIIEQQRIPVEAVFADKRRKKSHLYRDRNRGIGKRKPRHTVTLKDMKKIWEEKPELKPFWIA